MPRLSSYETHEALMIGLSVLSAIFSGTIIVTYAWIPAVRKKKYFELVFYIAVGNFLSSVGSSIGFVPDKTPECWLAGVLTNVFSLSSIAWTVVVAVAMYSMVANQGAMFNISPVVHTICWLLPVFITFIPLIEVRMGSEGGDFWCFYVEKDDSNQYDRLVMWRWIGYYFWVVLSVAVTIIIYLNLLFQMKVISNMVTHKAVLGKLLEKLKYYPLIIVVCWFPGAVYDSQKEHKFNQYSDISTTILNCIPGTLLGILFWVQNYKTILKLWKEAARQRMSSDDHQVQMLSGNSAPSDYMRDSESTQTTIERLPSSGSALSMPSLASGAGRSNSTAVEDIDESWS